MSTKTTHYLLLGQSGFIGKAIGQTLSQLGYKWSYATRKDCDLEKEDSWRVLSNLINPNTHIIMSAGLKRQLGDTFENWVRNETIMANFCKAINISVPRHVLYLSSCAVYGDGIQHELPINEKTNCHADSFYGISKINAERIIAKLSALNSFPSCFARPPLIYGSGDLSKGYGPTKFCSQAASGETIALWGDGNELREFISVEDLAHICVNLAKFRVTGPINIVSGQSHRFADIVSILKTVNPSLHVTHKSRTSPKINNVFESNRLIELIGDFDFTPLKDGVLALYQNFVREVTINDQI